MRALIQRVAEASVSVNGDTVGQIGQGLLILICAMDGDTDAAAGKLATKISKLRIFKDEAGKMNRSILDVDGSALVVSQFTLSADTRRGNRPGFSRAAPPDEGERLYECFATQLADCGIAIEKGKFGGDMKVALINDGPVTLWLDTEEQ